MEHKSPYYCTCSLSMHLTCDSVVGIVARWVLLKVRNRNSMVGVRRKFDLDVTADILSGLPLSQLSSVANDLIFSGIAAAAYYAMTKTYLVQKAQSPGNILFPHVGTGRPRNLQNA